MIAALEACEFLGSTLFRPTSANPIDHLAPSISISPNQLVYTRRISLVNRRDETSICQQNAKMLGACFAPKEDVM
jgi:hypothetical protein